MTDLSRVSIGLRGSVGSDAIRAVAELAEERGFRALWLSDSVEGDALHGLREAAAVTTRLRLGVGVLPLDRRPVASLAPQIGALPTSRLTLGVGSGHPQGGLARVALGIAGLRAITAAEIMVGALGPSMRRLGAREADGLVLNWLSPDAAVAAAADLAVDRGERAFVRSVIYMRTIMDATARPALDTEIDRKQVKVAYAANSARTHGEPIDATIDGRRDLGASVARYLVSVDEVVLRAVTAGGSTEEYVSFVERAALGIVDGRGTR